ncbi:MAG TPA: methyltransferase domain-containing protein [Ktedonobacterales bacterium]|nr:methyltransferase domain-containing protein [Ktedonobacterales bacterium]
MTRELPQDTYAAIATWYDVEHDQVTEDIECFQELIAHADLRAPAIVEIGCGTGRVLARLAAAGYTVTGVDPSEAMRQRCARRLAALPERVSRRVRVLEGDAEHLPLGEHDQYDLGIFSLNTFAHLVTSQARHRALCELAAHLRPGALLMLDLDILGTRRLVETAGQLWWQGTWPLPENNAVMLSHLMTATPSTTPGTLRVLHFYDIHEQGGQMRRVISSMSLAIVSKGEIEVALQHAGFVVDEVYGTYDLTPWDDASSRAIFLAHWPGDETATNR